MNAQFFNIIFFFTVVADSCLENLCLNGGTCVDGDPLRCICLPGYGGALCQRGVVTKKTKHISCNARNSLQTLPTNVFCCLSGLRCGGV